MVRRVSIRRYSVAAAAAAAGAVVVVCRASGTPMYSGRRQLGSPNESYRRTRGHTPVAGRLPSIGPSWIDLIDGIYLIGWSID